MIYILAADDRALLVIEPTNIDRLKAGEPLISPDGKLVVLYTPDAEWTMGQIQSMCSATDFMVDGELMDFIIKEGLKRPEVKR